MDNLGYSHLKTIDFITSTKLFFQNKVIWTESGAQEVDVSCWGHIQLPVVIFYYVEDVKMQVKMGQDL